MAFSIALAPPIGKRKVAPALSRREGRQGRNEVLRLHRERHQALDERGDVARVLRRPQVRVVDDAAVLVLAHLIAVDGPLDGAAPIHLIAEGLRGDAAQGQRAVHDEGGAVFAALPAEAHLHHPRVGEVALLFQRIGVERLVVQVQRGQPSPDVGGFLEVLVAFHQRKTRQGLLQVRRERLPIPRLMEEAVDVVENLLLRHRPAIPPPRLPQHPVAHPIMPHQRPFPEESNNMYSL